MAADGRVGVTPPGRRAVAEMERADRARSTRRRILCAALDEFGLKGLNRARVSTVGERAGVANGTVFYHFTTKSRLYVEAMRWVADEFYRVVSPVVAEPRASFMRVIDRELEFRRDNPSIDAVLGSLRGEHPQPEVREATRPQRPVTQT